MAHPSHFTIACVGEILWDLLPSGRRLGGAPMNFAFHASALGNLAVPASRVGSDTLGAAVFAELEARSIDGLAVQQDSTRATGTVNVTLAKDGTPQYEIALPAAWDFCSWTPAWQQLADSADAVCYGTLAQRSPTSRATIQRFVRRCRDRGVPRILDVNLRPPHWRQATVGDALRSATIVKLNHEELPAVLAAAGVSASGDLERDCAALRRSAGLELVCLTQGAGGGLLAGVDRVVTYAGVAAGPVRDTVGAGDAFTAVLIHHWLRGTELTRAAHCAADYAGWVVTQEGGTPTPPAGLLARVR